MVRAFGLGERTVARWQERVGQQCQKIQAATVMQTTLHVEQVHADKIRRKGHRLIPWLADGSHGLDSVVVGWGGG
jgi:hypothetical protein